MRTNDCSVRPPPSSSIICRLLTLGILCLGFIAPGTFAFPNNGMRGDTLLQGQSMLVGEALVSPSGEFFLTTQSDGNLCVYHEFDGKYVWCSRNSSAGESAYVTGMQTDGNLCTARVNGGGVAWCLADEPRNDGPFFLAMQDDANVCVYNGTPGHITGTVWCTMALATPRAHAAPLRYGEIYTIQNGWNNWRGGYLDVRGGGCEGNALCVSTARSDNRDGDSGAWMIVSAESKAIGTVVRPGDKVYLKNQYRYGADDLPPYALFGGYLDTRGAGCEDNALCVSTSLQHNRDANSATWTVEGARYNVYLGQGLKLRNNYVFQNTTTYLDTRGGGCDDNLLCVSASFSPNRDGGTGTWRFDRPVKTYAEKFAPRLRFDGSAIGYPMSAQTFYQQVVSPPNPHRVENTDPSTLSSGNIPTYFEVYRIGQQLRIKYWSFYGYQDSCFAGEGSHNGDWENVVVTVGDDQNTIAAVTFNMHGDYYTRLLNHNGFQIEETSHPTVYVGKTSHAAFYGPGGNGTPCSPWDEFRNNSNGTHLDSWTRLVDLNGSSETWIGVDRASGITWGANGVSTRPTVNGPGPDMNAAYWNYATSTWTHSQCKKGDTNYGVQCARQCKPGYTDGGLLCTNWSTWHSYTKGLYGYDYKMPTNDTGLLIDAY
jgi:hypothetical protein